MPRELTGAEEVAYNQYLALGTPDAIQRQIRKLKSENAERRQANADLEQKLKDAGVPEGSVVLPKDRAERLEAYEALGKPEDLKAKTEEAETLKAEIAKRDRRLTLREAAEAVTYKPSVLSDLAEVKGLKIEMREEKDDEGTVKKVPYVALEDGKAETLSTYVEQHLADYLPALTADVTTERRGDGTTFLQQQPSRTAGKGGYDPKEEGRKMAEQKTRENSLAFK